MIVTGVDFVSIPTRDLGRATEFYGATLGLPCSVHRPDAPRDAGDRSPGRS